MAPRIGIPLCLDASGRIRAPRQYHYIHAAYAAAISAAGGVPLYLPLQPEVEPLLAAIDGLLLPGGDDLPPPAGHPLVPELDLVPEAQLDFDRSLLRGAGERGLPLLGICYGMQLLVDVLGGTLLYHLPSDRPEGLEHRLPEATGRHALRVEPDTRLAGHLGTAPAAVNSLHHQGVADPGPLLRASAHTADGLIEAVERDDTAFCLGVQWHPEQLSPAERDPLFRAFVAACRPPG